MTALTEPPLRRVRQLRGYGALAVALTLVVALILAPFPSPAGVTGGVVAVLICAFGIMQLARARRTPSSAIYKSSYSDPNLLPLPQRIRYFQRQLLITSVVFLASSTWVAHQLNRLGSGEAERVMLWAPLVWLYEHWGYWPAVLATPALGVALCGVLAMRLRTALETYDDGRAGSPR